MPADGELSRVEDARLSASIQALLVAVGPDVEEQLGAVLERLDTGTMTEADRAMLDSLPPCHLTPHKLVRIMERLQREV